MPLIIEDGTGVANANSYVTIAELRAYAQDRGVSFPDAPSSGTDPADAVFTPYLIRAMDYLERYRDQYIGCIVSTAQSLAWPRTYWQAPTVLVLASNMKKAQCQLVLEQMKGIALFPSLAGQGVGEIPAGIGGVAVDQADGRFIVRDKIDVLETEYSQTLQMQTWPVMPAVDALLNPVIQGGLNGFLTGYRT